MKSLVLTNHAVQQYAARTGRNQFTCSQELLEAIRGGVIVDYKDVETYGFTILRRYKGDTYTLWYDERIKEPLLAIVAKDGAIKTVLRREMFSYFNNGNKYRNDAREFRKVVNKESGCKKSRR